MDQRGSAAEKAIAHARVKIREARTPEEVFAAQQELTNNLVAVALIPRIPLALLLVEALVPRRIADEEIGDALERIEKFRREGRPRWCITLVVASTVFWVVVHAIRDVGARMRSRM